MILISKRLLSTFVFVYCFAQIGIGQNQPKLDSFKQVPCTILDNKLPRHKIPKRDRLVQSDTISVFFMEGFTDSILVILNGKEIYRASGIENHSTGLTGMKFRIAKNQLLGVPMEIFSFKSMTMIKLTITDKNAEILMFLKEDKIWGCDIRNYRLRLL